MANPMTRPIAAASFARRLKKTKATIAPYMSGSAANTTESGMPHSISSGLKAMNVSENEARKSAASIAVVTQTPTGSMTRRAR